MLMADIEKKIVRMKSCKVQPCVAFWYCIGRTLLKNAERKDKPSVVTRKNVRLSAGGTA